MPVGPRVRSLGVAIVACAAAGCGGGAPLLHPAHVLSSGRVSTGAGVSGQFVFRDAAAPLAPGPPPPNGVPEQRAVEEAVARATLAPGLAPWVSVRAGLGWGTEAGVTYSGRTLRGDARHAFRVGDGAIAVSVGAGASAVFARPPERSELDSSTPPAGRVALTGPDLDANGFGIDVPVLIGWRSTASIVQAWAGARGGMEHVGGDLPLAPMAPMGGAPGPMASTPSSTASVGATRWYGGGLVGMAIGLPPLMVALELDVAYQAVSATASFPDGGGPPPRREGTVTGVTLAPAGAIVGKF